MAQRRIVRVQITKWKAHYHVTMEEADYAGVKGAMLTHNRFLSRIAAEGWIEHMRHAHFPVRTHKLVRSDAVYGEKDKVKLAYFYRPGD